MASLSFQRQTAPFNPSLPLPLRPPCLERRPASLHKQCESRRKPDDSEEEHEHKRKECAHLRKRLPIHRESQHFLLKLVSPRFLLGKLGCVLSDVRALLRHVTLMILS